MKIKEMLEDSRPRERLVKFGVENLSDAEVLALILEKGTRQENVIEITNRSRNKGKRKARCLKKGSRA